MPLGKLVVFGLAVGLLVGVAAFGAEQPAKCFEITCTSYANGESETFEQTLPQIDGKGMQLDFPPDILKSLEQGFCIFGPYTEEEEKRELLRAMGVAEPSYMIPDKLQGATTEQEKIK